MTLPQGRAGRNITTGRISRSGAFRFALDPTIPSQFASEPEAIAAFVLIADFGLQLMKRFVPVDEGWLKASLNSRVSRARGTIAVVLEAGGPDAAHWAFVEYGTGERGRRSAQLDPGLPRGYHHGPRSGMRAQPYMRPVLPALRRKL